MTVEPTSGRKKLSWPLAFLLLFLCAAAIGVFVFWRIETWPMRAAGQASAELERIGRKARDAFVEIARLQPRVTINDRVYFERTTGVTELALVSRKTEVEHEFMHTWAGSTKRIKLHGTFDVKAGFDLHENFSVDVREKEIVVQMPPARILSVEQTEMDVLAFENGLWNKISSEDVQNEMAALPKLAREKAQQSGLPAEAEVALRQQLEARLGAERPVQILVAPPPIPKP